MAIFLNSQYASEYEIFHQGRLLFLELLILGISCVLSLELLLPATLYFPLLKLFISLFYETKLYVIIEAIRKYPEA